MSLKEKLKDKRDRFEATAPDAVLEVMHRATDDLRTSGIMDRIPKVGERAPEFSLPNQDGEMVSSADLLARGPLVVTFYRGVW